MWTVRPIVVVRCKAPEVPVTVSTNVPRAVDVLVRNVSVLDVVAGLGVNVAVTPLGRLETARVTPLLNPFNREMVIVA